jgi:hypothetical protein
MYTNEKKSLMIDGQGDPNISKDFQEGAEALFSLSYTLKFMIKKGERGIDYAVMPLEGLWWTDNMAEFNVENKDAWKWTLMIMQPEYITPEYVKTAIEAVKKKKDLPALPNVRFEVYREGQAAQIMYIGPYSEEGATIEKIHAAIRERGSELRGKHHEIYLGDPRRTAPEKLRTIIRQPFE